MNRKHMVAGFEVNKRQGLTIMEIGLEIDGFWVQKSGRPRSLVGVIKEAIQGTRS